MSTNELLRLEGVEKRFGDTVALQESSISIERGSFVSIVGPSGCGKSTLFNVVAGLLKPDKGDILLDGVSVRGKSGHVGYMLQKDLLVPWRTVLGNITLGARLTRRVSAEDRTQAT